MQDRDTFYSKRVEELRAKISDQDIQARRYSNLRLLTILILLVGIYGSFAWSGYIAWFLPFPAVLFFYLVKKHGAVLDARDLTASKLRLCEAELKFMHGDKSVFDEGSTTDYPHHIYAADLDIFGKGSVFQAINRSGTREGRSLLIHHLLNPLSDAPSIQSRVDVINELAEQTEWRQHFNAIGSLSGEKPNDIRGLNSWIAEPEFYKSRKYWLTIAGAVSIISSGFIAWMLITQQFFPIALIALFIFNNSLYQLIASDAKHYFDRFGSRTKLLKKFAQLYTLVSTHEFRSTLGLVLKASTQDADKAYLDLSQLASLADSRLNLAVGPLMNGLFLFDLWTIHKIEKWKAKHSHRVPEWTDALAQVDFLCSLANYRYNHPSFCQAEILTGSMCIQATGLGHPLLPVTECVRNDYSIGTPTKAHIITGSNMAGKSTFIRAVGVNVVLALNGLPVCADRFSCSILTLASCIRITDSLEENASYFKAELVRLQQIVTMLKTGTPHLVLLDEIMRGTNSDDKRMGTLAFFKKLKDYNCLAMLATHDLVIGQLEEQHPGYFQNFCFESFVDGKDIRFDYKLRKGVSTSTNASFLMRNLNLID